MRINSKGRAGGGQTTNWMHLRVCVCGWRWGWGCLQQHQQHLASGNTICSSMGNHVPPTGATTASCGWLWISRSKVMTLSCQRFIIYCLPAKKGLPPKTKAKLMRPPLLDLHVRPSACLPACLSLACRWLWLQAVLVLVHVVVLVLVLHLRLSLAAPCACQLLMERTLHCLA